MALFSGSGARRAAMMAQLTAMQTQQAVDQRLREGQDLAIRALNEGQPLALGALDQGEAGSLDAIAGALPQSLEALRSGYGSARGSLDTARARFSPYVEAGTRAMGLYGDAVGLGGDEGYERATGAFRASPGYRYQVDQATDEAMRRASAMGALASGNTFAAVADRTRNLADQDFGGWLGRLNGLVDRGYSATGALAGLDRDTANLWSDQGRGEAALFDTAGSRRADIIGNAARGRAGIYGGTAGQRAGIYSGVATQGANAYQNYGNTLLDAQNAAFRAGDQAAANRLSLGMSMAQLLASGAGSIMGMGMPTGPGGVGGGSLGGTLMSRWMR